MPWKRKLALEQLEGWCPASRVTTGASLLISSADLKCILVSVQSILRQIACYIKFLEFDVAMRYKISDYKQQELRHSIATV